MSVFDDVVKEFNTLQIDFSKLPLSEVYGLQQEVASKMWLRENIVSYQEKKHQIKENSCKALLKEKEKELQGLITLLAEKEQEIVAREQSHVSLAETIKSENIEFTPEVGQEDEDSEAKVSKLAQIAQNLKK